MSKKILALALAFTFAFSVATVKADTVSDLQALIDSLYKQIQDLQTQIASLSGGTSSAICFDNELQLGMTSPDVKNLQIALNKDATTQVATTGAGSPGHETNYFGPLTLAAVKKFQAKNGIPTTGYVGPLTLAALNAKYCPPVSPTTTTVPPEETTTTTVAGPAVEGTLTASTAAVYTESSLKWGTSNQTIYGFKVKAKNSDITIKRIYVTLTKTDTPFIPWKDLSYIALYDGDNAVKGLEVTKANLVENVYAQEYDVYFDGLNVVVAKDTEKTFTIKVSTLSSPENKSPFSIQLKANGIRGLDGVGLNQYNSSAVAAKNIGYETTRATATIQLKNDPNTPKQGIILGNKTEVTKDKPIFSFGIKATNNDATLKTAAIKLTQTDEDLLTAVYLFDGDTRLANVAPTATTTEQTITFPDLNVSIGKDSTKYLTVKVDIAKVDASLEGKKITNITTAATSSFAFVDANDNNVTSITGSASGYDQTVFTAAPVFALSSTPKLTLDSSTTSSGVAQFVFTVKGEGDTVYIKDNISWFEATSSNPTYMTLGNGLVTASESAVSGYFEIDPDETITFTVEYPATAASSTAAMVQAKLYNVKWNTSATDTTPLNASSIFDFSTWKTNGQSMHL